MARVLEDDSIGFLCFLLPWLEQEDDCIGILRRDKRILDK